jgi:hypothetical protein
LSDHARFVTGELVYTGLRRTPVAAVLGPRVAAECFATMLDVYLVLGQVPEDAADCGTADNQPGTVRAAQARLARMLCADRDMLDDATVLALAHAAQQAQCDHLRDAIRRVVGSRDVREVIISGSGEAIARATLAKPPFVNPARLISLTEELGPQPSACLCAVALCHLAEGVRW